MDINLKPNPDDQLAIISSKAKKGEMGALRFAKNELKINDYPPKDTKEVFDLFFKGVKDKILKTIPDNAHLVLMPSTTGKNILPRLLAEAIKEAKPGVSIHNGDFKSILPNHQMEGKNKRDYISRMEDPISFRFTPKILEDLKKGTASGAKVFAVDDVTSYSEQFRAMSLQLKGAGIPVAGITTLRASTTDYPKENALKATFAKIEPHVAPDKKESFAKDFMTYLSAFPSTKLYRLDQNINVFTDFNKVKEVISKGASGLRELETKNTPLIKEEQKQEVKQSRGLKL